MFQRTLYGAAVSGAPRFAPFSRNCTLATPTLSLAVAVTVTEPDTVDPLAGAEIATVGSVVSALLTVTATAGETSRCRQRRAPPRSACEEPFVADDVFHTTLYGDVVSGAPRSAPSSRNCTLATPTLSLAVAVTVTEPETRGPTGRCGDRDGRRGRVGIADRDGDVLQRHLRCRQRRAPRRSACAVPFVDVLSCSR